jgi:hypothetical protein
LIESERLFVLIFPVAESISVAQARVGIEQVIPEMSEEAPRETICLCLRHLLKEGSDFFKDGRGEVRGRDQE